MGVKKKKKEPALYMILATESDIMDLRDAVSGWLSEFEGVRGTGPQAARMWRLTEILDDALKKGVKQ